MRAQAGRRDVIQQDEQLEASAIALQGHPIGHLCAIATLIHGYVFPPNDGDFAAVASFRGNDQMHGDRPRRGGLLGLRARKAHAERGEYENDSEREALRHLILL